MSAEQTANKPPYMSEDEAALLSRPRVTLFVDASPESSKAFSVLEQAQIGFRAIPATDSAPFAQWGNISFEGVSGVSLLADTLEEFETVLIRETEASMPGFFEHPDIALQQFMQDLRKHQLDEARTVMAQLYQSPEANNST